MSAPYLSSAAVLDSTGAYRYSLDRQWASLGPTAVFIGLNPSTADAQQDDPTIRREVNFAKAWGCARLLKVNIFALRSTDPAALYRHPDPIGPANDQALLSVAGIADFLIACWGKHGALGDRGAKVVELLRGHRLSALRLNKDGSPAHPLYLPGHLTPIPFGGDR